jgi:ORF6N domain
VSYELARPAAVAVPIEAIKERIHMMRGEKVMLDEDLAQLYGVETKVLVQAVKRNLTRFPSDFMFRL